MNLRWKAKVRALFGRDDVGKEIVSERFIRTIQREVVQEVILDMISKGISPVTGKRLAKYKDPEKYPGNRKPKSPVNLELSGEMLSHYRADRGSDKSVRIGIHPSAPHDVMVRAQALNEGNDVLQPRPFIPLQGQQFTAKVRKAIRDKVQERLSQVLRERRGKK